MLDLELVLGALIDLASRITLAIVARSCSEG